jgi:hypothetical protein
MSEVQPSGFVCVAAAIFAAATQTKVYLIRVQSAVLFTASLKMGEKMSKIGKMRKTGLTQITKVSLKNLRFGKEISTQKPGF